VVSLAELVAVVDEFAIVFFGGPGERSLLAGVV
jgi:hypothetical protein